MAVYCWLIPIPRVRPTGVTAIEEIVGALTARVVEPVTPPSVAEMVVVPAARPVARPLTSIVAVDAEDELQLTKAVRSRLLPSL